MKRTVCLCISVIILLLCPTVKAAALSTSAKAAALVNGDTGELIFGQNTNEHLPMASTTKIMTALLLCENGDLEREITVTEEMLKVEGSSMGLLAGDRVTLHDLLYGMLLASGNDAANVTAYTLGGSIDGFVQMMNTRAAELGLKDTRFETPSGLDGEQHYTTASDLAQLARYALQNKAFAEAAASKSAVLSYGNPPYKRMLSNHNKLLNSFEGAVGVKTGFTKKAGRCLVSAARRDGKYIVAVTLNDPNDWQDHKALLEYGFSAIKSITVSPEIKCYTVPVIGGTENELNISIQSYTVNTLDGEGFECKINLPRFVYAPVNENEAIGSVIYTKNGIPLAEYRLCSDKAVAAAPGKDFTVAICENIKYIFKNIWEK